MRRHLETGKEGELLAARWLINNGYEVLYLNWRHSHYEIDVIATRNKVLHFIEVKTRTNIQFGHPEESVSKKKFSHLMTAAEEFMFRYPRWQRVQYDILSITMLRNETISFDLIEDIHYSNL